MKVRCPTCNGARSVPVVYPHGTTMCISPWPTEACQTCGATGWIEETCDATCRRCNGTGKEPSYPPYYPYLGGAWWGIYPPNGWWYTTTPTITTGDTVSIPSSWGSLDSTTPPGWTITVTDSSTASGVSLTPVTTTTYT